MPEEIRAGRAWLPVAALLATLTLTVAASWSLSASSQARDQDRFSKIADETVLLVRARLDSHVGALRGAAALCAVVGVPDPTEFTRYAERFGVPAEHRALRRFGLALRGATPAGPDAAAVLHLHPAAPGELGADLSEDPALREAMRRARETGQPAASARVRLGETGSGVFVFVPFYAEPAPRELRDDAVLGYVFGALRVADALDGLFAGRRGGVDVAVYDGPPTRSEALVPEAARPPGGGAPRFEEVRALDVYGRDWQLRFRSNAAFDRAGGAGLVPLLLGAGLACGMVLYGATRSQARARSAAERIAAELRRSEASLRSAKESAEVAHARAESANRVKDEFLATVSHELRTPLNAMLGWTQLLRSGRLQGGEQTQALEVIERNAKAQAQLVEDLLDVSRILAGKIRLDVESVDLTQIVEAALAAVLPAARARGIRLKTRLDPEAGRVNGDPARLQQVVWNLLSNAIKFTPPGGRVALRLARGEDHVRISVKDSGIGIPQEFLPYVFDRFRQADASTTRKYGGLGLGLGIVRNLVELHGGSVRADSGGEGLGAMFTVALPIRPPALPEETLDEEFTRDPTSEAPPAVRLDGVTVLVVDDEPDARALVARALGALGARVDVAASAAEAWTALQRSVPDVLVSDVGMPEEDGWSLLRRVRALPGERGGAVPAVALTAFARVEDRARSESAGFQLHLAKPVEPARLAAAVAELARYPVTRIALL